MWREGGRKGGSEGGRGCMGGERERGEGGRGYVQPPSP